MILGYASVSGGGTSVHVLARTNTPGLQPLLIPLLLFRLICRVMDGDKEVLQTMDAKVRRLGFQSGEGFSQALLDFIEGD